ncbi:MAG: hypothetical protein FJ148_15985 [Deltaproteobacteria bacterium]|nr:hypothetical protein [Deltaproteobacteria bacterium]
MTKSRLCASWSPAERLTRQTLELGQCRIGLDDLDRRHAEHSRRLLVAANAVEEACFGWADAELRTDEPVDAFGAMAVEK